MKSIKKQLVFVLAIMFCMSIFGVTGVKAADESVRFDLGHVRGGIGETVSVPLYLAGVDEGGIGMMTLSIEYDTSALTFESVEKTNLTKDGFWFLAYDEKPGRLNFILDKSYKGNRIKDNGEIALFKFKVNKDGKHPLYVDENNSSAYNYNNEKISSFFYNGYIFTQPGMLVTIGNVSGKPGSTVTVPVKLSNLKAKDICNISLLIDYDNKNLTLESINPGESLDPRAFFQIYDKNLADEMVISCSLLDGMKIPSDGVFATIKLKINENAKVNEVYKIIGTTTGGACDSDAKAIYLDYSNGSITVTK